MNSSIFSDPVFLDELNRHSRIKNIEKDTVLIHPGDEINFIPLVQEGVLRIVREDADGREVFLYHLYPGQTCAMAINCCQAGQKSMVKAIAEADTRILQIPVKQIEEWFKFPEWRSFVNNTYSNRFAELLNVIDLIAFSNMDKQVLHYLQERTKAANTNALFITHQQIADEMHTHREAISRLLRTMEQKEMVRLGRNSIEILI
jgi:CRP/FNR family transcriptional regulator